MTRLQEGRRRRPSATAFLVTELVVAALAIAAGLLLAPVPAGAAPGSVQLHDVVLDDEHVAVLVVPGRPGANLVQIAVDDDVSAGRALNAMTHLAPYAAAGGRLGVIWLAPGRNTLWVQRGPSRASFPIDTGNAEFSAPSLTGPDGPECASAALGAVLSHPGYVLATCPADELDSTDAVALTKLAGFLARRGTPVALLGDSSARSGAAQGLLRTTFAAQGTPVLPSPQPGHPVIITAGWLTATKTLDQITSGRTPALGTYLAPWLLTAPVLAGSSGAVLPLPFDPHSGVAQAYRNVLRHLNDTPPSAAGYRAFVAGARNLPTPPIRLYAVSRITLFPNGHDHGSGDGWMPGGTTTAVTTGL